MGKGLNEIYYVTAKRITYYSTNHIIGTFDQS